MKLAFCSEYSNADVSWLPLNRIPLSRSFTLHARPNKSVLGVILLLEQGKFPVLKLNAINEMPLKESGVVHEAYIRCHISVVPVVSVEPEEGVSNYAHLAYIPDGEEEPDRFRPDEPVRDNANRP